MKVRFSHLSLSERCKIERWRQMKLSPDEMARRLGRHRSTIFRELRRNHFHDSEVPKLSRYWLTAQGADVDVLPANEPQHQRDQQAKGNQQDEFLHLVSFTSSTR